MVSCDELSSGATQATVRSVPCQMPNSVCPARTPPARPTASTPRLAQPFLNSSAMAAGTAAMPMKMEMEMISVGVIPRGHAP